MLGNLPQYRSQKFDDCVDQFYGNLTMVVADNLVAHALGGVFCNFSTCNVFVIFVSAAKKI